MAADLAALCKPNTASGYKYVKLTTSKKRPFQAWMKDPETGEPRQLGTFETAEEAAEVVALALRDGPGFSEPVKKRNKRGTVRARSPRLPSLQPTSCVIRDGPQASLNDEEREAFEERVEIERVQLKARKERARREREERKKERKERRAEPVEQPVAPRVPPQAPTSSAGAFMASWLGRSPAVAA